MSTVVNWIEEEAKKLSKEGKVELESLREILAEAKEKEEEVVREAADEAFYEKDDLEEVEDLKRDLESLEHELEVLQEKHMPFKIETLDDEMKMEVLQGAMKKYTLLELEKRLGNKFDLMC
jgi:hypothetical protein